MNIWVLRVTAAISMIAGIFAAIGWFLYFISQGPYLDSGVASSINGLISLGYFVSGLITWAVLTTLADIAEDMARLIVRKV